MSATAKTPRKSGVLVTGGSGYIGHLLVGEFAARRGRFSHVVSADVREVPSSKRIDGVEYVALDVRDAPAVDAAIARHGVDTVVHLASIVTPAPGMARDFMYDVDVRGTRHVLDACARHGVRKLVVTSSGAAYGYHADNAAWLHEDDALRGNEAFAYSHHKRLVEEMLAAERAKGDGPAQLVFRLCTVLGPSVKNQITALFEKPVVVGIAGSPTPFVLIADDDVVEVLWRGAQGDEVGVYNVAGDGVLTLREIAARLRKPFVPIPATFLRTALRVLQRVGRTQYGPEQVDFLRYRPVLANDRLKHDFGYTPRRTTAQVFESYLATRG
jgi:UDP-glucose 4-epimerase